LHFGEILENMKGTSNYHHPQFYHQAFPTEPLLRPTLVRGAISKEEKGGILSFMGAKRRSTETTEDGRWRYLKWGANEKGKKKIFGGKRSREKPSPKKMISSRVRLQGHFSFEKREEEDNCVVV